MRRHGLRARQRQEMVEYFLVYCMSRAIAARKEQEARLVHDVRVDEVLKMLEEERKRAGKGDDRYLCRPSHPNNYDFKMARLRLEQVEQGWMRG